MCKNGIPACKCANADAIACVVLRMNTNQNTHVAAYMHAAHACKRSHIASNQNRTCSTRQDRDTDTDTDTETQQNSELPESEGASEREDCGVGWEARAGRRHTGDKVRCAGAVTRDSSEGREPPACFSFVTC
jgi:hypothetical protein